jgi:hypothetical protein
LNFLKRLLKGKIDETKDQLKDWLDPDRKDLSMPCDPIILTGIDQALYDKLLSEADAAGVKFNGFVASIDGCKLMWAYDPPSGTLHATCVAKPFYVSCNQVTEQIQKIVASAKGGI